MWNLTSIYLQLKPKRGYSVLRRNMLYHDQSYNTLGIKLSEHISQSILHFDLSI